MGLAEPEEVPEMFLLRNLKAAGGEPNGPHTGEKVRVSIEEIIAAEGPRDPPASRSQKVFNAGFVYLVEPGQVPDPGLLRTYADFRDRAVTHWQHITGGRSRLTTEIPAGRR